MFCLTSFLGGIAATIGGLALLTVGGFVFAARVREVMREIERGSDR